MPQKTAEEINRASIPGYLKNIQAELKVRNYSPRTIKNYGATVNQYLHWLKKNPSEKDVPEIKKFQLYLKEAKNYSPRTVNLVTAAIQFFYLNALRLKLPVETLPRMKTGRPLPKVYSEKDIEKILSADINPKHRLLLMIAYGCGARLSEKKRNVLICPAGNILPLLHASYRNNTGLIGPMYQANIEDCQRCMYKKKCLTGKSARRVALFERRDPNFKETFTQQMIKKFDSDRGRYLYSRRMGIVEPEFGHIRNAIGLTRFSLRGKAKVDIQWKLFCIVHNLKKIFRCSPAFAA